jgi:hypothetical protein
MCASSVAVDLGAGDVAVAADLGVADAALELAALTGGC